MKKIDLHIHTIATEKDVDFEFSIDALVSYVQKLRIDAIAITNHNCFDRNQFELITSRLVGTNVFPGIEIDVENGHMLVLSSQELLDQFEEECKKIEGDFKRGVSSIDYSALIGIFEEIDKYLLIPHYDKEPSISEALLRSLREYIEAGEVQSPKKFERCKKEEGLSPVLFSDWRANSENEKSRSFPTRQTFLNCEELSIPKIKYALENKDNVSLVDGAQNREFQMLDDGTIASTGLNVVLGKRSSGKTYTLDTIARNYPAKSVKYIRQFDLVSKSESEKFSQIIEREKDEFTISYFKEFKILVDYIASYDWDEGIVKIEEYIKSLKNYAVNKEKDDIYSKVRLFTESTIDNNNLVELKKIIEALLTIIEDDKYEVVVETWVKKSKLKKLYLELVRQYYEMKLENVLIGEANKLVKIIKESLGRKSSLNPIEDVDLKEHFRSIVIEQKFNELVVSGGERRTIKIEPIFGFTIETEICRITTATDINSACAAKNTTSLMKTKSTSFDFYRRLMKEREEYNIKYEDIHRAFWKLTYRVKNAFGSELSGGEKAEYNLLAELRDDYSCRFGTRFL